MRYVLALLACLIVAPASLEAQDFPICSAPAAPSMMQNLRARFAQFQADSQFGSSYEMPVEQLERLMRPNTKTQPPLVKKGFSHWGYRHNELHSRGFIDQLMQATGDKCCNGPTSGECRVSEVDLPNKKVMIDGKWCKVNATTKLAVIEGLSTLNEGEKVVAMVCAGINLRDFDGCPSLYCVGVASGQ